MDAFWIILTGILVSTCCSLLGCYLILRKMAMVGDAISHAVLPGIVLAFLFTGTRDSFVMLTGAGVLGIFTTFLIQYFHTKGKLQTDASIGVTFTSLFAVGIILISVFAGKVDLDQDCVLYGEIAYVPLDVWFNSAGTSMGPRAVWIMGIVLIIILLVISLGYKELYLTTFDPSYALVIGIGTTLWHYILMGMVSLTTVAAFESVGAILVVAFLIAPAATAYLLTTDFRKMLILSVFIGVIVSFTGYYFAEWLDASIAGAMSAVAGVIFGLAFLFSPTEGFLMRKLARSKD
jgi:manganese/zinc/iron transport system permease protein